MNKSVRRNANVNIGDIISLHAAPEISKAIKVKILPFDDDMKDITQDTFETHIKPYFKDKFRPLT